MQCYQSSLHFSSKKQSRPRAERIPVGYTSRGGSSQSYLPYNYIIYIYIIRWNDDHLRIRTWGPKASIIILTPAPPLASKNWWSTADGLHSLLRPNKKFWRTFFCWVFVLPTDHYVFTSQFFHYNYYNSLFFDRPTLLGALFWSVC